MRGSIVTCLLVAVIAVGCNGSSAPSAADQATTVAAVAQTRVAVARAATSFATTMAGVSCPPPPPGGFAGAWRVWVTESDLRPTVGDPSAVGEGDFSQATGIFLALTLSVTNLQPQPAVFPGCDLVVTDLHAFTFPYELLASLQYDMNLTSFETIFSTPVPAGATIPTVAVFDVRDSSAGFALRSTDGTLDVIVGR